MVSAAMVMLSSSVSVAPGRCRNEQDIGAPVARPPLGCPVAAEGARRAVAFRADPRAIDATGDQILDDGLRPLLGQAAVPALVAQAVGVALHADVHAARDLE